MTRHFEGTKVDFIEPKFTKSSRKLAWYLVHRLSLTGGEMGHFLAGQTLVTLRREESTHIYSKAGEPSWRECLGLGRSRNMKDWSVYLIQAKASLPKLLCLSAWDQTYFPLISEWQLLRKMKPIIDYKIAAFYLHSWIVGWVKKFWLR